MTSAEEQLRLYAGAITEGRPPLPPLDRSRTPEERHHRGAFALAAAVLVVVLLTGAVLAMRNGGPDPAVTTTATEGGVVTQLSLSTDAPAPDETVTATLTLRNEGDADVELGAPCGGHVALTADPAPKSFGPPGGTFFEVNVDAELSVGDFRTAPWSALTLERLQALAGPDAEAATAAVTGCASGGDTLAPGESRTITSTLAVGSLGMSAGPGLVSTTFFGASQPPDVTIPITIPRPPEGVETRADAVAAALAEPSVQELIASLPSSGGVGSTQTGVFLFLPLDDGWQVGYAQSTGQAFLVTRTSGTTRVERAGAS